MSSMTNAFDELSELNAELDVFKYKDLKFEIVNYDFNISSGEGYIIANIDRDDKAIPELWVATYFNFVVKEAEYTVQIDKVFTVFEDFNGKEISKEAVGKMLDISEQEIDEILKYVSDTCSVKLVELIISTLEAVKESN